MSLINKKRILSGKALFLALLLSLSSTEDVGAINWTSLGPEGAHVNLLAVAPTDPSIIYAGLTTFPGIIGLRKSIDGGDTWFDASIPEFNRITGLVVHPQDSQVVYAADSFAGLFQSRDGGGSWTQLNSLQHMRELRIDPNAPNTLYAARHTSEDGDNAAHVLLYSTDEGVSWQELQIPGVTRDERGYVHSILLHPTDSDTIFVATYKGIFRSRSRGQEWEQVSSRETYSLWADADAIEAGGMGAIWRSTDDGNSWRHFGTLHVRREVLGLLRPPHLDDVILARTRSAGLWLNDDGGETWHRVSLPERDFVEDFVVAGQRLVAAVLANGVQVSEDQGQTWEASNRGLDMIQVNAVAVDPMDSDHLMIGLTGFEASHDRGNTWQTLQRRILTEDGWEYLRPTDLVFDPSAHQTVYAATRDHGVLKSRTEGRDWEITFQATEIPTSQYHVQQLILDDSNRSTLYAATRNGVLKTTDGGGHWSLHNDGLPSAEFEVRSLAQDPQAFSTLYAGLSGDGVYRSLDEGESWKRLKGGLPTPFHVFALAIDPQDGDRIYAAGREGAFQSSDGGTHWVPLAVDGGGPSDSFLTIAVDPATPQNVYLGTTFGLFQSTDRGQTWHQIGRDGGELQYYDLTFDTSPQPTLYAATSDGVLARFPVDCSDPKAICFQDERFTVEVSWRDFDGQTGPALLAAPPTSDSALLYFFNPNNWEMLVKVINGCGFNGHHWVFAASATNLGTTVQVTDTTTGAMKIYQNDLGSSAPALTDTEAFACP